MPLHKGKSDKAFSENVRTEMHHGKPLKQSLAIAYAMKRKAKKAHGGEMCAEGCDVEHEHKYAMGGYADGGSVDDNDDDDDEPAASPTPKPVIDPKKGKEFSTAFMGFAEGGDVKMDRKSRAMRAFAGEDSSRFREEEKATGYRPMPHEPRKPNAAAMKESDRGLGQHGMYEIAADGMADDNEPQHETMYAHDVENQEHDPVALDMVGQIMKARSMKYAEGGEIEHEEGNTPGAEANYTGPHVDFEDNQFDDLVKDQSMDADANYTGANSGDEIDDEGENERRHDIVSQIMKSRKKKDRLPHPA